MDEKADHVLLLAIAVGLAGGTAAAVASLAFPHVAGMARTIIHAKRKKEQRELRNRTKIDKVKKGSKKSKESGAHTNVLRQLLVKWKDIDVTMEKFPYFLSMVKTKDGLRRMVTSQDWLNWPYSSKPNGQNIESIILDNDFWRDADAIQNALKPLWAIIRLFDREGCTMALVYQFMQLLGTTMQDCTCLSPSRVEDMVQIWRSRWDWFHRPIHAVAHLLHPLYKDVGKWSDHVLAEGWAKYTQRVYDATIQNKLEDDVLDFKYSRGFFARPIAQMRDNHLAPISWWEKFGNMNEELQHLALRVLSQDCTTGSAERVWSICGDIHTKKRNRENTKTALLDSMYIYLKCPEYGKYVMNLPSVSPRILLTGPPGSELYQEQLVKSLAHHLQVNVLVLDLVNTILEVKESQSGSVEKTGGESQASSSNAQKSMLSSNGLDKKAANDTEVISKSSSTRRCTVISQGNICAENRIPDRNCVGLGLVSESFSIEKTSVEGGVEGKQSDLEVAMPATVSATVIESSKRMPKKGDRVRYVGPGNPASTSSHRSSTGVKGPTTGSKGKILLVLEENPSKVGVKFDKPIYGGNNLVDLCEDGHGYFCNVSDLRLEHLNGEDVEKLVLESLIDLLTSEASKEPIILFVKEVEKSAVAYFELYKKLEQLEKTEARVVVVGSHTVEFQKDKGYANSAAASSSYKSASNLNALLDLSLLDNIMSRFDDMKGEPHKGHRMLAKLFPTRIYLQQPQDEVVSSVLNRQLTQDAERLKAEANRKQIRQVMGASNIMCNDLSKVEIVTHTLTQDMSEKIVGWAVSHHLQRTSEPEIIRGKILIKGESLQHSFEELLSVLRHQTAKKKHLKDVVCENEFEKTLLAEVIPPDELRVTFDDIGALENVKEALRELVMLPLQRPELFSKGQLQKPCKGLLLFGPPGTGKTMLAKAVATESGAFFINLSLATIASKWFGEAEKFVKAVFTLASKIEPCVIFIDEVDSMLARRGRDFDSSAMRKLKNEFMSSWDGLRTREKERVLVLAATNRPFDLDEAVIRRFPRRLMVDLPDKVNRKKILEVILADEEVDPDVDLTELASTTDGYSGSDLKNLCITAAYERIREILNQEKQAKDKAKKEGVQPPPIDPTPCLRPLNMSDLKQAMGKVRASVATSSITTMELQQWNDQYGEGGARKQETLTYFL